MRGFSIVGVVLAFSSCGPSVADDPGLLNVVTTVSPITNIAENVGGDHVEITGIVPEGTNSHEFEPAPSDARIMASADVVFVNGLNLELPSLELAAGNVREGTPVVRLGERTIGPEEYIFDFSFPREGGDPNPHLWTHPLHALRYAEVIRNVLLSLDPENEDAYAANYEAFADRIEELDRWIRECTETVPPANRKLLTYHDSFPYFAREYGWEIVGAIQPSDFGEPAPSEVAALIEQIRNEGVPAIFGSEVFPSPALEQIARESGARYVDDLRDDDLPGAVGDPEHTYLGLMVYDYRTFMTALGGDPGCWDGFDTTNVATSTVVYRE